MLAEDELSLERIQGAMKQHHSQREVKPVKPPLRSLQTEITLPWSKPNNPKRRHCGSASLADCFRALHTHAEVNRSHQELRKDARQRKREQLLQLLAGASEAARVNDTKRLYQYIRLLSPKLSSKKIRLRGSKRELLKPTQECSLLASYARGFFHGSGLAESKCDVLPSEWFTAEWSRALKCLRARKAVPNGSATIDAWQQQSEKLAPTMSQITFRALTISSRSVPQHWCKEQLAWIPKVGKTLTCPSHLRTVVLMAPDTKAFLLILKEHANPYVQDLLQRYPQYAYRQGHSTDDPILRATNHCHEVRRTLGIHEGDLTTRILGKNEAELANPYSLALAKAFDSVDFQEMRLALIETGMPIALTNMLVDIHVHTELHICHVGNTEVVRMTRGLRQGCPVAPMIYTAWVCRLFRLIDARLGESWSQQHMNVFADG